MEPKFGKKIFTVGALCFLFGAGTGFLIAQKSPALKDITAPNAAKKTAEKSAGVEDDIENAMQENTDKTKSVDLAESDNSVSGQLPPLPLPATAAQGPVPKENAIMVADQAAGKNVLVDRLLLTQTGWVVIHEDDRGRPGWILGAGKFPAGVHADVKIELLRGTSQDNVYYAMMHEEDGDGAFDFKKDLPLLNKKNAPIMLRFHAAAIQ